MMTKTNLLLLSSSSSSYSSTRFQTLLHIHRLLLLPTTTASVCMSFSSAPNYKSDGQDSSKQILRYHRATKHSISGGFARGPKGLDWANQPDPFRRYNPTLLIPLLHPPALDPTPPYPSIFLETPTTNPNPRLCKSLISQLFYDSLSLSAWKTTGHSPPWSLRVNPSSGNLHPTEAYLISPEMNMDSLGSDLGFVAHYSPKDHTLEVRARVSQRFFEESLLPRDSFLVGISSVFWREAWKYGERAFRYCNHDVGHAIAAVTVAAAAAGFDARVLDGLGHDDLAAMMGLEEDRPRLTKSELSKIDSEHPDCVIAIFPRGVEEFKVNYERLSEAIKGFFSGLEWKGNPNPLSEEHVCWDEIYKSAEAVKKPRDLGSEDVIKPFRGNGIISEKAYDKGFTVREVVRKRRSAVDMDGVTNMESDDFYQVLIHCLPSSLGGGESKQRCQLAVPFRVLPWDAEVHAALFVHRVNGLLPGLYFLVRNEEHFDELKSSMKPDFEWVKPEGCPEELPLFLLDRGDYRRLSQLLSCHQEIARDGCFSLGMIARFETVLREKAWMYPRLFWESGVLGQVLYLEAHAIGISATGIGCYFDDTMHEVLGLTGSNYQSLYHFTVGGPVVDKRIMSLPAYPGHGINP